MKENILECWVVMIICMYFMISMFGAGIERGKREAQIDISEQSYNEQLNMFGLTDDEQTTAETINKGDCQPWEALSTEAFVMLLRSGDLLQKCSAMLTECTNTVKEITSEKP